MRKPLILLILIALFVLTALPANACEPCQEMATFDEAVEAADLIIVGQMVAEGPSTGDGPEWITVQVIDVLKGEIPPSRIRVNSWDGMCLYGFAPNPEPRVMLLEEGSNQYNSVLDGCAISEYLMQDNLVTVEVSSYTLEEFVTLLGPNAQLVHIGEPSALSVMLARLPLRGIVTLLIPLCVVVVMAAAIIGGYVFLRRHGTP